MGITTIPKNRRMQDGVGNPLAAYKGEDGDFSLDVHNAHVHNVLINRHFIKFDSATENPSVAISSGDTLIQVASTTGFTANDHLVIKDASGNVQEHHFDIISTVPDTSITINRPIDNDYTTSATLEKVDINMNVVGTLASPVIYKLKPPGGENSEVWHINRILISITDNAVMDDEQFGGSGALTNGVILREVRDATTTWSMWKANKDLVEDMHDVTYAPKAPAGFYGLRGRFTFEKASVVARLDGANGDYMDILIQDNLSGLESFKIKGQGHIE